MNLDFFSSADMTRNIIFSLSGLSIFFNSLPHWGFFSGRLHQVPKQPKLSLTIYIFTVFSSLFLLTISPNPPCQLSLWEETGGENPRLSAEC